MSRDNRPRSVYGVGTEPDPRFSLANERTLLAWLRTGLALMAAGVALQAVDLGGPAALLLAASVLLLLLGMAATVLGWVSWRLTERAIRLEEDLPAPVGGRALLVGTVVAGGVVVASLLLG